MNFNLPYITSKTDYPIRPNYRTVHLVCLLLFFFQNYWENLKVHFRKDKLRLIC